ncbi:uncharacterized protein [Diadema setosum]|uniref:uncharacterized protein n=1 Tax=Diadema setosum TaxID=31175 RepID=UPI003B3B0AEE
MNALRTIDGKSQVKVPSRKKGGITKSTPNRNNVRSVAATSSSHLASQARTTNRIAGCATAGGRGRAPNADVAISSSKQKTLSKFSTARDEKTQLDRGGVKDQSASLNNVITLSDLVDRKNAAEPASSAPDTCGNSLAARIQKHSLVDRRVPGRLEVDGHQRSPLKVDSNGRRLGGSTQSTDTKVPGLYERRRKIDRTRSVPSDRLNTFGVGKAIRTTTSESHTKCQKRSVKSTADRGRRKTMDDDRDSSSYPAGRLYSSEVGRDRTNLGSTRSQSTATGESQPVAQQPSQDDSQTACYRKIAPNASKREKLVSGANKELEEFEKYKASKKLTIVTGQAQSTGGAKSMEDARREMEKLQRNKKYEQIRKREKWQQEKREREERELNEKKARAREQTKKNQRLSEERAARSRHDHARTNEDFFKRLEDKSACPVSSGGPDVRYSQELQSLQEMFPDKDPAKLQKMLELTNGDVSEVTELLM